MGEETRKMDTLTEKKVREREGGFREGGFREGGRSFTISFSFIRNRDSRSKELFEKVFPELRSKRDQLRDEAYSRSVRETPTTVHVHM